MTEDEAKKKLCPQLLLNATQLMVRLTDEDKINEAARTGLCQASDCMMWRWIVEPKDGRTSDYASGYCGLADKP